ncbi:LAME_0H00826g1_1 [Lachancea meyersii CBS 8951]|uniref:LAME_0H00826g1_1 n=1 Tax=Lachancea meyersii CBS 8951 TaxID=1266667 RepID=A0A1G4KD53_9SACH|nr:LAME_0H00826g1_1 [Lachancea meyersii CBS 8951]
MGLNAWNELLEANRVPYSDKNDEVTIVLSAETQPVLQDFLMRVLQVKNEKSSLAAIGYYHKIINLAGDESRSIAVHVYTVEWPLNATTVDLLSIFVNSDAISVRWVFLLDWLRGSHKCWLRGLFSSFDLLKTKLRRDLQDLDFCTIVGMETQVCKELELTSPDWSSLKMEFLNQTMRSLALIKRASLVAIEESTPAEILTEIGKVVLGQKSNQIPDHIAMNKLFVPQGSDSERKIKTMGEEFPVRQIEEESFIAGQFERLIPGESHKNDLKLEITSEASEAPVELPEIDVQKELAEIYKVQKSSLLNSVAAHNSTIDIPNAKETSEP